MSTIWLVKFDREHTTPVELGENQGRTLTDYNVVRTLHQLGSWTGEAVDLVYDAKEPDSPAAAAAPSSSSATATARSSPPPC